MATRSEVAEWEIRIGWATAALMLVARLTTVVWQLGRPLDPVNLGQALFKSAVLVLVVLRYRRQAWPAYLMLGVWPFGFVLAWWFAHPPLAVLGVGLLVGVAFFLGAHGVWTMRRLRQPPPG